MEGGDSAQHLTYFVQGRQFSRHSRHWSEGLGIVAPVVAFFGCVRGSSLLFSNNDPRSTLGNSPIFGHLPFCQKYFGQSQKKSNAKAKKWRNDLYGKS
jgi:hypothetical protein